MRNLILLLIGLFLGAMGATVVSNTLQQRSAYARGAMNVMQHHYVSLREDIRARRCDANRSAFAIAQLRALSAEIAPSTHPDSTPEAPFREFLQRLDSELAAATPPPAKCAELAPLVQKIGKVCDDCHQQYR